MLPTSNPAQWATISSDASGLDCTLPCPRYPSEATMCEGASVEAVETYTGHSPGSHGLKGQCLAASVHSAFLGFWR